VKPPNDPESKALPHKAWPSAMHYTRTCEARQVPNGRVFRRMSMFVQDGSPCSSAAPQRWPPGVCSRSPGYLLLVPGWRLGLLTGGKTARTNRAEAWTLYRGGRLGEESGQGLGHQTGGRAGKKIRARTGISNRWWSWEKNQGRHGHFTEGRPAKNTRTSRQS
jgi:hypothetical protein